MDKKVTFTGIEIYSPTGDVPADQVFKFIEEVVRQLESQLDGSDEDFHFSLQTNLFAEKRPSHKIYVNGLRSHHTKEKVVRALQHTGKRFNGKEEVVVKVDFQINSA